MPKREPVAADPVIKPADLVVKQSFSVARYRKTVAALVAGVLGWAATTVVPDGHVDRAEWYALAVVLAGVFGVWVAPNTKPGGDPEAGYSLVEILALVVLVVLAVVGLFALLHRH